MQTENDTPKPEDSPKQEASEGCSGATCYADYMLPESAPRDRKIMGFFEDIGWNPACWSEVNQMWNIAYCAGVPETNPEEPKWIERMVYADDLCWWREWPSNRWQDNPYHSSYGEDYDSDFNSQHNAKAEASPDEL